MALTNDRADAGTVRLDPTDGTRQMDGAWRVWETLGAWDKRFAWAVDSAVAVGLFLLCSGWLVRVGPRHLDIWFTAALTLPLMFRRRAPFAVFVAISAVALVQWTVSGPLLADAALLVALYTVAADSDWLRVVVSLLTLEIGVIVATVRWTPVGRSYLESLVFLTGMAVAAFLAGSVVRALRGQLSWLAERAQRLERERDQQTSLAAAAERSRIAREMHDVVSHNLQVMVTLADAASVAQGPGSSCANETMGEVASTGRQALTDMRRMLGLWRDEAGENGSPRAEDAAVRAPQPGIGELEGLVERVRATGLPVVLTWHGVPFELSEAAELTVYRIVQEALTNALRHAASPDEVQVRLTFADPDLSVQVTDDGCAMTTGGAGAPAFNGGGHGVTNMTERAAAFGGTLTAGPLVGGGWRVETTLHGCRAPVRP